MNEVSPPNQSPSPAPSGRPHDDRLDSWKEIAAYLKRDVTTVQRWEKREGMPVHRHLHDKIGSVYAFRSDLDAWARSRNLGISVERVAAPSRPGLDEPPDATSPIPAAGRRRRAVWLLAATGVVLAAASVVWLQQRNPAWQNPLVEARFSKLTDFDGIEQAAALSRDGKFAAFLSDRDGRMDVWVTQVGSGKFHNLTHGNVPRLVNPSVRTLGFSPDGARVTFWARGTDDSSQPDISIWAAPVLGGKPQRYLEGVAEFDWSGDGTHLVYHTPGPGDPMYVRDSTQPSEARNIFSAPPGLHGHFLVWSPDRAFIYFVQGSVPNHMDIWRIRPTGGAAERITNHDSVVSHPVFLSSRTLLYLATDSHGSGPWIHTLDVDRRLARRVSFGIDTYTSLAASAAGQRIVATAASPKSTLWRVPISAGRAEMSAQRIPLTTGNGSFPRLGSGYVLYVSSKGASDSIWKLQGDVSTELWSAPEARIMGGPAIARDGRRIAFSIRQNGQTLLYIANADGTDARIVTRSLELQGPPAWKPDGQSVTVAATVDGIPRLFNVPLDGRSPVPFVAEHALDPVWSPEGDIVAFSGADIGTTFPVKVVKADGTPYRASMPTLTRGARHLSFMPERRSLVVLRGELGHKNLWVIDLETGGAHQLTDLASDFDLRDFDISPDGREIVLERVQEQSDIVLIDIPRR